MRFQAIQQAQNREPVKVVPPSTRVEEFYGKNVFGDNAMRTFLNKDAFRAVREAIAGTSSGIDREMAAHIALGMKRWAISNGVSHYTHWFQPLTGLTAEKHDSFYEVEDKRVIEKFSAGALVQQEPDASSLPSGGLRNTFEARGYTAWDPTSPAFIYENTSGKTLCIPTVFVSYNGEALDYKAPLLKSLNLIDLYATKVCKLFNSKTNKVRPTLGVEQEYFLVDEALFNARPDLLLCGRTVFGAPPPKGQQMEDHYFGSIPDRVFNYMYDLEIESFKLGIPLKTRHNEVAPGQYECAPMFEDVNLAVDHNQLLMDLMDEVAARHKFKVLLHEKPFAEINGSGKHNNWSLSTDTGENLLSPGSNPLGDMQFLAVFINTIKAVHDNQDIIRASIASAGNDHRLGANEAPPAIISIFIGSALTKVLEDFENGVKPSKKGDGDRSIFIDQIPEIKVDNTDRNRTSPFAFTGNKFELRAVGSAKNSAQPMTIINTAVANQFAEFLEEVDAKVKGGSKKNDAIAEILQGYIKSSKQILFEGNGYSDDWVKEAKKRGLSNITNTPDSLKAYIGKQAEKVFIKNEIFTKEELHARYEIMLEEFVKKIQIEGRVMGELANTYIIPAAQKHLKHIADTVSSLKNAGIKSSDVKIQISQMNDILGHLNELKTGIDAMTDARRKANKITSSDKMAKAYNDDVKNRFEDIRKHADKLERMVSNEYWPLPKYTEMLFIR
jgi:glutamine synthetase